jgi:peptidyl-prolyl cis-trans isomerase A (cyclophilin A)
VARRLPAVLSATLFLVLMVSACGPAAETGQNPAAESQPEAEQDNAGLVTVVMSTQLGQITLEIDTVRAPITAKNFLQYLDDGLYVDGSFSRTVHMDNQPTDTIRIEVIQWRANLVGQEEMREAIPLERTSETGLKHLDGTISMARGGADTATASFFICIGDQPSLDFGGMRNPDGQGFAAFGRVISDMSVVRSIQMQPADGQSIIEPVVTHAASRAVSE